jgi:hypothetical protein
MGGSSDPVRERDPRAMPRRVNEDLRTKLATELLPATWASLDAHFRRDALFLVDARASLLDVAVGVAADDRALVAGWIESGVIRRPTLDEASRFAALDGAPFLSVVVQPFVLVQRVDDFATAAGGEPDASMA